MTIVAHHHPFVIGVDTHARSHALAILACPTAEVVDQAQFPTTTAGSSAPRSPQNLGVREVLSAPQGGP